jgi:hypothetical protein
MNTVNTIRFIAFLSSCFIFFNTSVLGQKLETPVFQSNETTDSLAKHWSGGLGIGLDASMISLINPRVNEGESRISTGGMLNFWANYENKRVIWQNKGSVQLSLMLQENEDWTKSADALMYNTQVGIRIHKKWFFAVMADVQTQVLNTYDYKFIAPTDPENPNKGLTSRFFAPATLKIAPGFLWKPKPYFSLLLSAVSNKNIIVADDYLASLGDSTTGQGLFGNTWSSSSNFSNFSSQLGAQVRADFNKKFAGDKILLSSTLDLYSNYLKSPENIAVEWTSSLDISITNYMSFCARSDWFYDHNVLVRVGGNPHDLGRRVFIRNAIFLKFNRNF